MKILRVARLCLLGPALLLLLPGVGFGQEWIEYVSREDMFTINFPAQPKVEEIQWKTEYNLTIPGHVHRYDTADSHYSVTAVDYSNVQKIHADRVKGCTLYPDQCGNPYVAELRGAMEYAAWQFLKRDAKVTYFAYGNTDRVEGRRLQLTNADGSRTFAQVHMRENHLYIFEATVPKSAPSPALFQQSVGFIDENGGRVRYNSIYSNAYPPPTRVQYQGGAR
jgi:hypothetical protein